MSRPVAGADDGKPCREPVVRPGSARVLLSVGAGGMGPLVERIRAAARGCPWPRLDLLDPVTDVGRLRRGEIPPHDVVVHVVEGRWTEAEARILAEVAAGGRRAVVYVDRGGPERTGRVDAVHRVGAAHYVPGDMLCEVTLGLAVGAALERQRLLHQVYELQNRVLAAMRSQDALRWEMAWPAGTFHPSPALLAFLGAPEGDRSLDTFSGFLGRVHPEDAQRLSRDFRSGGALAHPVYEQEIRVFDAHGRTRWMLLQVVPAAGGEHGTQRFAGQMMDVTETRERMEAIRRKSRTDALTGLPRREVFFERLAHAIEVHRDLPDAGWVVLLLEVEGLRRFNESIGHHAGDQVLASLAKRFAACVDSETLIARFGGAKFAVLVENVADYGLGDRLADRFSDAAKSPVDVHGEQVYVTVSIGITSSERNYTSVDDVISDVSTAATRAKAQPAGRKRRNFSTNMRMEALTKMRIEMALREAVKRDELDLHFQPIVSLVTGHLVGFESLLRWESPTRGRISPAEFIPIAESTGLIQPIGRWAIERAASYLRAWMDEVPAAAQLAVSVNLSGRQVSDPELLHAVARAINRTQVNPENLKIELTESVLMDDTDHVSMLLSSLRELGVKIWVDDFGTGYSSLSYLHRFPVDGLKIDKTFVDGLRSSAGDSSAAMVRTMVSLSEQLDVELVAEGVETQEQADRLRDLGCAAGQGYFFGRPCPPSEALELLKRGG